MANLRTLYNDDIGVDIDDTIISDAKLRNQWDRAFAYWNKFRIGTPSAISVTIDSSLTYTFTDPIPTTITTMYLMPNGLQVSCRDFFYVAPTLTVTNEGEYAVVYNETLDIDTIEEEDIPIWLRDLFVAYAKRQTAQFLKFSNYQDKPFEVDAEQWYTEAQADIDRLEELIKVNRDEDWNDLSDLTGTSCYGCCW